MYGSYVSFPDKRTVRITYGEENLLDSEGYLCVEQSQSILLQILREDINGKLIEGNTTVKYSATGETKKYSEINETVPLQDIKEQHFEVTSLARYNTIIVNGTSCTQVRKKVLGTMIITYLVNPNARTKLPTTQPLSTTQQALTTNCAICIYSSISFCLLVSLYARYFASSSL